MEVQQERSSIDYEAYMSRFHAYKKKCIINELIVVGIVIIISLFLSGLIVYFFGHF